MDNITTYSSNVIALKEKKGKICVYPGKKTKLYSKERKLDWYQILIQCLKPGDYRETG